MDALLDDATGGYWQCCVFQPVILHLKDLFPGRFVGREEERNRTRQFFHDILSSKILIASFIAHEIYQRLVANGAEEAKELGRVTKLLQETIHDIPTVLKSQQCGLKLSPSARPRASIVCWTPDASVVKHYKAG